MTTATESRRTGIRHGAYGGTVTTQVIVLNGGSSSGTSSIARHLQALLPGPWLVLGIDTLIEALPPAAPTDDDGIAFHPDGEVSVGARFRDLEAAWNKGLAAMARAGARVIVDDVFLGGSASQERLRRALDGPRVAWVGVRCDAEVAAGRERARGDRVPGMAARQAESVHAGVTYDLEVDTTHTEAIGCARTVAGWLRERDGPPAAVDARPEPVGQTEPVDRTAPVDHRDLADALADSRRALTPLLGADWSVPAGALEWSCRATAAHIAHDLLAYAGQLAALPDDGYLPLDLVVHPDATPAQALRAVAACGKLLCDAVAAAPSEARAWHWGPCDPEGFAAMGTAEILLHTWDITRGLGAPWAMPGAACAGVLRRLFPDAPYREGDPASMLLWCTGRGELPGRPRRASWTWAAAVAD